MKRDIKFRENSYKDLNIEDLYNKIIKQVELEDVGVVKEIMKEFIELYNHFLEPCWFCDFDREKFDKFEKLTKMLAGIYRLNIDNIQTFNSTLSRNLRQDLQLNW